MWRRLLLVVLLALGLGTAGCSIYPFGMVIVNGKSLEGRAGVRLIDPNDPNNRPRSIEIAQRDDGSSYINSTASREVKPKKRCRVKYHKRYYSINHSMVVEGELAGGKKYPVLLDTGASPPAIVVQGTHIIENKLPIYPLSANKNGPPGWRYCHLPELQIGELTLANYPGLYWEKHMEVQLFGLPVAHNEAIIVGLPMLQEFKYIAFDSVKKEVEFSLDEAFEPGQPGLWAQYPFSIETDFSGNAALFLKIAIAGEDNELHLDTGTGRGLAIDEDLWETLSEKIRDVKLKSGRDLYPYIGRLACKRGIIGELQVGDRTVKNAKISIFPNDSPLVSNCQGLLGMQYFRDTVMVLDFENNLMWIKNPQSQQGPASS